MAGLDSFVKLYSNYNSAIADNWNSKTLTANGSAQIDTSIKKFGAGSLLLASATSDFVSISDDSDFDLGSGDFAFDLQGRFVSLPTSGNRMCLFSSWNDTTDEGYKLCVYNNSGVYELEWSYTTDGSTEKKQNVNYNFAIDTFYHIAVCRNTTSLGLFVNGANIGGYYVGTDTIHNSSEDFKIGAYNATEISFFDGYVDEFRFSKGTARYTTNSFTPPTSNATADSSDVALLHMDGSDASQDFVDDSLFAEPIFGTGMGKFDGNSDYLTVASHVDFNYGTGDFALESRVFFKSFPQANNMIIDQRDIAVSPLLYVSSTGILYYFVNGANRINGGSVISLNTWYHVAVARSSGTTKLFLDGTQVGSSYTDSNNYGQTSVTIAKSLTAGDYSDIFIDELRISKGAARYTTNFTVPSSELTNDGNTSLLLNCNGADESTTFTDSSTTGHTVTANGTAQISDGEGKVITVYGNAQMKTSDGGISPKSGTAMGKFDGTGDNLSFSDASDINFSNNNFLIESWVNVSTFPTTGNSQVISSQSLTGNLDLNYIFGINNDGGNYRCFFAFSYNGTTQRIFYAYFPLSSATWYHISVFRVSDTIYLAVDGNIISSFYVSTNSLYDSSEIVYIACRFFVSRTDFLNGYMDEFRISNGVARYTPTSFTPPSVEYSGSDVTAPTILTLAPTNLSTSIAIDSNFVVTFDESVTAITGNDITIKRFSDDVVMETIDAADAKITVSGAEVTINPAIELAYNTKYYIEIEDGAFEDAATNATSGLTGKSFWSFTTIPLTTTSIFEVLEYDSTIVAEAGTTTTNITSTANDMSAEDFIVNTTRRSTAAERGSRRITAIVDADNFTVGAIAGQTTSDSIRLYKFVDRTDKVKIKTLKCSLSTQGTRILGLTLVTTASWVPQIGQYCRFGLEQNSAYTRYFLGIIQSVDTVLATGNFNVGNGTLFINVTAANLTTVPMRRTVEIDYDSGDAFDDIVKDMVDNYLIQDGIGQGYIASGESLDEEWTNDIISISDVLNRASKESTFQWFVNEYGSLQFFNEEIAISDSPYNIDEEETDPTGFYDYFGIVVSSSLDQYVNKQFIMGGFDERGNPVAIGSEDFDESTSFQNVCAGSGVYGTVMRDTGIVGSNYVSAIAGTTTTNITYNTHNQVVGNMVWNLTRNVYRIITAVVDANNFTVDSVTSQTSGDIIVFFDKANDIIQNVFKTSGRINYKVTFLTRTLGFLPGQKIEINLPSFGLNDEYFAITNVEISDFTGIQQKDYNGWILKVDCVIRNNSNFSTQRLKNYEDFWANF